MPAASDPADTAAPPIPRVEAGEPLSRSADVVAANVAKLRALFPEALTEGPDGAAVDVDVLKALVGDRTVTAADEKFGLNWHGKRAARRAALTPSGGTLRPKRGDSVDWDGTGNVVIEGDNLEVLKLLQKSYAGEVKLIYIDPPYNTGKDFVYPDDYRDGVRHYRRLTGQTGEDGGGKLTTNTETGGRFHTRWLNMMLPRVKLGRELLTQNGFFCVSVDDVEHSHCRMLFDELFGGENFVASVAWQNYDTTKNDARHFSDNHEGLFVYAKGIDEIAVLGIEKGAKQKAHYRNPDDDPRGEYLLTPLHAKSGSDASRYTFTFRNGVEWQPPPGRFPTYSQETLAKLEEDGRIYLGPDGTNTPQKKTFWSEVDKRMPPPTFWDYKRFGSTRQSNREIADLVGKGIFQNPKPTKLIQALVDMLPTHESIILDFFAGSGTTGHAVMAQNAADGGSRRYVLVQLPEPLSPDDKATKAAADYCDTLGVPRTLAELTKERLRRAAAKVRDDHPDADFDGGFRVYSLDTSNVRPWDPDRDDLEKTLLDAVDHVRPDRSPDDLLTEVLLKLGLDLCTPIATLEAQPDGGGPVPVHCVGDGALFACLAEHLDEPAGHAVADLIADWFRELNPESTATALFRDAAFASDVVKVNVDATLKQAGLADVRSL